MTEILKKLNDQNFFNQNQQVHGSYTTKFLYDVFFVDLFIVFLFVNFHSFSYTLGLKPPINKTKKGLSYNVFLLLILG
jgi:hypothetical protein